MHNKIHTEHAPKAIGPYSQAIKVGNMLFISGQTPLDPTSGSVVGTDIKTQTRRVLQNVEAILKAAGMQLSNVVKCSCFIKNLNDFAEFNAVYTEFFGAILPARECVEVARNPKDVLIEISAIAIQ